MKKKFNNYPILILLTGLIIFLAQCGKKSGASAPTISSVDPTSGLPGDPVTIHGTDLTGATSVSFNATTSTVITATNTSVTTVVPMSAAKGTYNITVTSPSGTSNQMAFTVYKESEIKETDPAVIVKTIPQSNYSDYPLLIHGNNLSGVYNIKFNDKDAVITTFNHTCITTVVPKDLPAGDVTITIYTNEKPPATIHFQVLGAAPSSTLPVNFSVVSIPPPNYVPNVSNEFSCGLMGRDTDSTFDFTVTDANNQSFTSTGKYYFHYNSTLGYDDLNYVEYTNPITGEIFAGQFSSKTGNPCISKMITISSITGKVDSCTFDQSTIGQPCDP